MKEIKNRNNVLGILAIALAPIVAPAAVGLAVAGATTGAAIVTGTVAVNPGAAAIVIGDTIEKNM